MLTYHSVAFAGSQAYDATCSIERSIMISVTTSNFTRSSHGLSVARSSWSGPALLGVVRHSVIVGAWLEDVADVVAGAVRGIERAAAIHEAGEVGFQRR